MYVIKYKGEDRIVEKCKDGSFRLVDITSLKVSAAELEKEAKNTFNKLEEIKKFVDVKGSNDYKRTQLYIKRFKAELKEYKEKMSKLEKTLHAYTELKMNLKGGV